MLNYFIAFLILSPVITPILLWLFVIRPYCRRHGQGYTPGANWLVTMWIDWQQAREIAMKRREGGILWACRILLVFLSLVSLFQLLDLVV